ncbi:CpaF family protein [Fimbriiglobus ruber]|uniref:Type II/IV secretion system ATP hydrolase TadA/VirB11/CpaF, TadA subfamily n=1 Tax=Fimbriiglobus ruber TaxID=1908690 RepID=A0A225E655_9BACT|nr:CpaF family protein [Fimbriiglobus ruber]OWK44979.1 Type II/IV secretion system ATP hydrolase TadA/VirB11/CpaF, TadA subfamily [Fimbriiglobus ruber]
MQRQAAAPSRPPGGKDKGYQQLKSDLHRSVVEALDLSRIDRWKPDRLRAEILALTQSMAADARVRLTDEDAAQLTSDVIDEVFGLGPLEVLFADGTVTEVLVNGADKVYVERNGTLRPADVSFTDNAHLIRVIQRLAARVGRRIDESSPMLDARLPDGSRVNAVFPPLTVDGPVLSIRRFGHVLGHEQLQANESVATEMIEFLWAAVASKINVLISGGTGAGKTTLLNILAGFIPPEERIVTVEDAVELRLPLPHVVRMEARLANLEGHGQVTQHELVRNSLRMRPDRIIVGEVRGREAMDMLQAMNTGHEGSLTTIHANDTRDALSRLEMMVSMAGFDVPVAVLRGYIAKAITVVVHLSRVAGGARKMTRISEIRGIDDRGRYRVKDVFKFDQTGVVSGRAVGTFKATGYVPKILPRLTAAGHDLPADLFAARTLSADGTVPPSPEEGGPR